MERLAQFNEVALLETINQRLAPKFRQMICKEQERIQSQQQMKMSLNQEMDDEWILALWLLFTAKNWT